MRFAALLLLLLASVALAAPSHLLVARGAWAAFDRGTSCEAVAKPIAPARKGEEVAHLSITFDRSGTRHGQLYVQLRRPARSNSTIILSVGEQPFMLVGKGFSAWSKDGRQEMAIIAAMRNASGMRIDARDTAGRRMADRYLLDGAPTAIDAAAAACSFRR